MKLLAFSLLSLLFAGQILGQSCTGNLLQNPGFESDLTAWDGNGAVIATTPVNAGTKSLKLCSNGETRRQTLLATPGKTYRFSWYCKTAGPGQNILFGLKFLSSNWQVLSDSYTSFDSPTAFTANFLEKTAPPGTARVEVGIVKQNAGCIYVDDCCLTETGGTSPCSPDVTPPNLSNCPVNISLNTSGTTATASWAPPSATDNCAGTPTATSNFSPGAAFPIGTTVVTYTAKDAANNTATCSFSVTVSATAGGGCAGNLLTNPGFESGLTGWGYGQGSPTVVTDAATGSNVLKLTFQAFQLQNALVTPGKSYSLSAKIRSEGLSGGTTMFIGIKFMDANYANLGSPVQTFLTGTLANWTTLSTATATAPTGAKWCEVIFNCNALQTSNLFVDDACLTEGGGGTNPCSPDLTPPLLTGCPASQSVVTAFATEQVNWTPPTATDNCAGTPTLTSNFPPGYFFPIGATIVTYTAKDAAGNTATCSFTVNVASAGLPDLAIQNFTMGATTVEAQKAVAVNFDIKNLGGPSTNGAHVSQTTLFLSTDNTLDAADKAIHINYYTPGAITAGATVHISQPLLIPADVAAGAYFVIVKTDALNLETELSETNNTGTLPLTVKAFTGFPCQKTIAANGSVDCISYNDDGSAQVVTNENGTLFTRKITTGGTVGAATSFGPAVQSTLNFENGKLVKRDEAGTVVFSKTIPAAMLSTYPFLEKAIEFGGGFVIAAFKNAGNLAAPNAADRGLTLIKTDQNLAQLAVKNIVAPGDSSSTKVAALIEAAADRVMLQWSKFTNSTGWCCVGWNETLLTVVDAGLDEKSTRKVGYNYNPSLPPLAFTGLRKTSCGWFAANEATSWSYGGGGGSSINYSGIKFFEFVGDTLRLYKSYTETTNGGYGSGNSNSTTTHKFTGPAPGGGDLVSTRKVSQSTGTFSINWQPSTDSVRFQHGSLLNKLKQPYSQYLHEEMVKIGPGYFIVHRDATTGRVTIADIDCDNNGTQTGGGNGADIEISMTADKATVPIYGSFLVTVTAKNTGNQPVASAQVKVAGCAGAGSVLTFDQNFKVVWNGAPAAPTAGAFNFVSQIWTLSNLAPGQSATLKLPLFTLSTAEKKIVAQSIAQSPADPDSQPSSAALSSCTPAQDDEAVWVINLGQSGQAVSPQSSGFEEREAADFTVFPNPTAGFFSIELGGFVGKKVAVSVADVFGKTVFYEKLAELKMPGLDVDLSSVAEGVYFVRIESEGVRSVSKRLVVSKL